MLLDIRTLRGTRVIMPQATTPQQGMVKEGFILAGEATHTHSSTVNNVINLHPVKGGF